MLGLRSVWGYNAALPGLTKASSLRVCNISYLHPTPTFITSLSTSKREYSVERSKVLWGTHASLAVAHGPPLLTQTPQTLAQHNEKAKILSVEENLLPICAIKAS